MYVQWAICESSSFKFTNGVRQGGILSPKLFIVYMDDLSDQLNNSNIGGNFGSGQLVNHSWYAETIEYLCDKYSNDDDLIYNSKKLIIVCACVLPQSHVNHMNVSFRLTRNPFRT